MHGVVDMIARKHGFDESTISRGYIEVLRTREKVGILIENNIIHAPKMTYRPTKKANCDVSC
jgi:hypothetical protein